MALLMVSDGAILQDSKSPMTWDQEGLLLQLLHGHLYILLVLSLGFDINQTQKNIHEKKYVATVRTSQQVVTISQGNDDLCLLVSLASSFCSER